jgi:hypothetical protein
MIKAYTKSPPPSVRQRLLNSADKRKEPIQRVLVQYGFPMQAWWFPRVAARMLR